MTPLEPPPTTRRDQRSARQKSRRRVSVLGVIGEALIIIGRHIGIEITGILIVLAINLGIGFLPGMNVAWQAHVGGLVAGALVGLILARTRQRRQRPLQIALLVVETVILLALLLIPIAIYL